MSVAPDTSGSVRAADRRSRTIRRVPTTALVHDYLLVMRGAERTFAAMASCWPKAPIYTLLCDRACVEADFAGHAILTSYLQRLRLGQSNFRTLMPLFPRAIEKLPLAEYDMVISSSSAFAHGVHTNAKATHVSYCHSPFRYAWHENDDTLERMSSLVRPLAKNLLYRVREWDRAASQNVSHYIANSQITQQRIQDFYKRDANIVHPPVEVERFHAAPAEDFFLVVSEMVSHKRLEIVLEAAKRARLPLVLVGGGPDLKRLASLYGSNATFMGRVSDETLVDLYARARAFVMPNIEEFGIAAVEAQAAGRPVIAADGGGARETIAAGKTGVLVPFADVDALAEAMVHTDFDKFSPELICAHARQFSVAEFRRRFAAEVARLTDGDAGAH